MAEVRSSDLSADRWVTKSGQATAEYEEGVRNPRRSWADGAAAAEDTYKAGVAAAAARGAYGKGVREAGDDEWQRGALEKGTIAFGPGVARSREKYERNVAPYLDEIRRTTLPARRPAGDPANLQRVAAIANALHRKKVGG